MSQFTDIYNSLMNDPDIIPPKKMSKDKFVLNLAQQRVKQHENNAEALEMGFSKTLGHSANGNSNDIGFQSAVKRLSSFVASPEASPPAFLDLLKAKGDAADSTAAERNRAAQKEALPKIWYNAEDLHIDNDAAAHLLEHDYTRDGIKKLLLDFTTGQNADIVNNYTLSQAEMVQDAKWHDKEGLDISSKSLKTLEEGGHSRTNIRAFVKDFQDEGEEVSEEDFYDRIDPKSDEDIQNDIEEGQYEEEINDIKGSLTMHTMVRDAAVKAAEMPKARTTSQDDESTSTEGDGFSDPARAALQRVFGDSGLKELQDGLDNELQYTGKLWNPTGGTFEKKGGTPPGEFVSGKASVGRYLINLRKPDHPHHAIINKIKDMPILDGQGNETDQNIGQRMAQAEPEIGKVVNVPPPVGEQEGGRAAPPVIEAQPAPEPTGIETPEAAAQRRSEHLKGGGQLNVAAEKLQMYAQEDQRRKTGESDEDYLSRLEVASDNPEEQEQKIQGIIDANFPPLASGAGQRAKVMHETRRGIKAALDYQLNNLNAEIAAPVETPAATPTTATTQVTPKAIPAPVETPVETTEEPEASVDAVETTEEQTDTTETPTLGFNANTEVGKRLVELGYDPKTADVNHLRTGNRLTSAKIQQEEDAQAEEATDVAVDADVEPEVLTATDKELPPAAQKVVENVLKTDRAIKQARMIGLADKDGNLTEMGNKFFEKLSPLLSEAVRQFASVKGSEALQKRFDLRNPMRYSVKEDGELVGVGGAFLSQLRAVMNNAGANLHQVYDENTGELKTDRQGNLMDHNNLDRLDVLNGNMVRNKLLSTARREPHNMGYEDLHKIMTDLTEEDLVHQGMNRSTARRVVEEESEVLNQQVRDGTIDIDDEDALLEAYVQFQSNVEQEVADEYPKIAATPRDWSGKGKQLDMFEKIGFEPMSTSEPTSAEEDVIDDELQNRRQRGADEELPGFEDALRDARTKDRRAKLTPRQRQIEDLKKVMHGDSHEHLDSADAYSDKEIKDMWNKEVRDPKAQTVSSTSAGAKSKTEGGKVFNREKALKKLARLQNPDLDIESDEFNQALAALHEDYDEEVGYTDKDIQDALKSQAKLSSNQASQQSQERQNRASGADRIRAVSDFEDRFQTPEKWAEEHDGEEMSPEMAKEHLRELINFQHSEDNFQHFSAKTGDPDDFKALRERLQAYSKLNPAATGELAAEIKSAQRAGIDIGSEEFLTHANELKEAAELKERQDSHMADSRKAKLAHALENGNFSRGYDKDGNEGHHNLDHNGNPEHDTSEIEHEDGKAPLVHALDENGYPDEKIQALVDELHDAKLATPKADREYHKAKDDLLNQHVMDLSTIQANASKSHSANNDRRDAAHQQVEDDHDTAQDDLDRSQVDADDARVRKLEDDHSAMLTEHNERVGAQTDEHEDALEEHDSQTQTRQAEYDEHKKTIEEANEAHNKAVAQAETDNINASVRAEQSTEEETARVTEQFDKTSSDQLKQHEGDFRELQSKNSNALETLYAGQNAEWNAAQAAETAPEEMLSLTDSHASAAEELKQSTSQQESDLEQSQQEEKQSVTDSHNKELEGIKRTEDAIKGKAEAESRRAINKSHESRYAILQGVSDAEELGVTVQGDDDIAKVTAKVGEAQSSHETDSAATRENMESTHGASIESQRKGLRSKIGRLFAKAPRDAKQADEEFEAARKETTKKKDSSRLGINQKHVFDRIKIQEAHNASKAEATTAHTGASDKLTADKEPKDKEHSERLEASIKALREHPSLKDDPEKFEAVLKNGLLGQSAEQVKTAHEEAGSGLTGEKDTKGEDKKPEKTRMVKDPETKEMKKQYWIPGRGKGWVDEDTYNASHGQNADAAKDGKMMIYPEGHFDAGHGAEGDEDFRAPSPPMAGHGVNMFSIHTADHPDAEVHDDALDHDGVVGRALGNQLGITDHANFTAAGAPFAVDLDSIGMGGMGEAAGEGKGKPRGGKMAALRRNVGFGEAAQERAKGGEFAAYGRAAQAVGRKFAGAVDYLANTKRGGQKKSAVQNLVDSIGGGGAGGATQQMANVMRGGRQTARQTMGGAYTGKHKPVNERQASMRSEMWRRIPKPIRALYSRANPEHAREMNHTKELEDRQERKSSQDQWKKWSKGIQQKIDARPEKK